MVDARHSKQTPDTGIHVSHAFEFANAATRLAYSYSSEDVGKIIRQTDNNSFYILGTTGPSFSQIDLTVTGALQGSITYFNGTTWANLAPGTDGYFLQTNGSGANPEWSSATAVPSGSAGGDLGGTYPNPTVTDLTISSQVQGSVLYFNGTSWVQLTPGTDGYFLQTNGPGANPEWASTLSGSATPSGVAGGDLGGTYPNPTVTNLTISGEVEGSILYFDGLGWVQLSPDDDGYVLTTHGSGEIPTWELNYSISLTSDAPADVTKATASVGVATTAARADHKHNITTATAGTIAVGDAASEGSATSLARSDHVHALTAPAAPENVTKAAASAGVASTVARSDHKHDITTATASSIGASNAEGSATSLARSDHTHAVTNLAIASQAQGDVLYFNGSVWTRLAASTDGYVLTTHSTGQNPTWESASPDGLAGGDLGGTYPNPIVTNLTISGEVEGSILYFDGLGWVQLSPDDDGYVLTTHGSGEIPTWELNYSINLTSDSPTDVTKATAVVGVATTAARADHKHNISTAVSGTIAVGDAASEGSATSLARSDHVHALTAPAAPVNVTKDTASAGSASTVARSDHKHDITTATASSVGASNSEGSATSLARSDHTHAVTNLAISSQTQGDILYFNGSIWTRLGASTDGYVLTTHSTGQNPTWAASSGGAPSGAAGGDLGGTYPNPTVTNLTIPSEQEGSILYCDGLGWVQLSPSADGYVLTTHSTGEPPTWAAPTGGAPSGSAGGDLSGTYPNPTVRDLTITNEEQGAILYFNGTNWVRLSPSSDGYVLTTHSTGQNPTWNINSPSNLNANLNANNWDLDNVRTVTFNQEFDNENSGTADTINWNLGQKQKSTLTGNVTYTFVAPLGPCNLVLKIVQDGTGGRTAAWPASVLFPGGTDPTITTTAAAVDIISFYYDGTNYYGVASQNFS